MTYSNWTNIVIRESPPNPRLPHLPRERLASWSPPRQPKFLVLLISLLKYFQFFQHFLLSLDSTSNYTQDIISHQKLPPRWPLFFSWLDKSLFWRITLHQEPPLTLTIMEKQMGCVVFILIIIIGLSPHYRWDYLYEAAWSFSLRTISHSSRFPQESHGENCGLS